VGGVGINGRIGVEDGEGTSRRGGENSEKGGIVLPTLF